MHSQLALVIPPATLVLDRAPARHCIYRCIHPQKHLHDRRTKAHQPRRSPRSTARSTHPPRPHSLRGVQISIALAAPAYANSRGFLPWRLSDDGPVLGASSQTGPHPNPFTRRDIAPNREVVRQAGQISRTVPQRFGPGCAGGVALGGDHLSDDSGHARVAGREL